MIIKVNNQIFDVKDGTIIMFLTEQDKKILDGMPRDSLVFAACPKKTNKKELDKQVEIFLSEIKASRPLLN